MRDVSGGCSRTTALSEGPQCTAAIDTSGGSWSDNSMPRVVLKGEEGVWDICLWSDLKGVKISEFIDIE